MGGDRDLALRATGATPGEVDPPVVLTSQDDSAFPPGDWRDGMDDIIVCSAEVPKAADESE